MRIAVWLPKLGRHQPIGRSSGGRVVLRGEDDPVPWQRPRGISSVHGRGNDAPARRMLRRCSGAFSRDIVKISPDTKLRVAVVLSHPTQYYSPWFRWMRSHTTLQFKVFYLWDFGVSKHRDPQFGTSFEWDVDLLSGYESEIVPNLAKRPGAEHFFGFKNPALIGRLEAWRPDALLLFGYKWASHLRVIRWARAHGVPLLF